MYVVMLCVYNKAVDEQKFARFTFWTIILIRLIVYVKLFSIKAKIMTIIMIMMTYPLRGAGSKLKVGGGAQMPAQSAGKKFFLCPPLFCRAPPSLGGTAHTRVGTKMGSHSPLYVRKEMACS